MYGCAKPSDFQFSRDKVLRLAEQQVGGITRNTTGELSSAWNSNVSPTYIYAARVLLSQRRKQPTRMRSALVLREQTSIDNYNQIRMDSGDSQ